MRKNKLIIYLLLICVFALFSLEATAAGLEHEKDVHLNYLRRIPSAYGNHKLISIEDGKYFIITDGGGILTDRNEVPEVKLDMMPYTSTAKDCIGIAPVITSQVYPYDKMVFQVINPGFRTFLTGWRALRFRSGDRAPMETLPNFVEMNGKFVPLKVEYLGGNPIAWWMYRVSWDVLKLNADGRDKIKFLSPYALNDQNVVLSLEYAIRHDRMMWATVSQSNNYYNCLQVTFFRPAETIWTDVKVTDFPKDVKINDYYFTRDGRFFIVETVKGIVIISTESFAKWVVPIPSGA